MVKILHIADVHLDSPLKSLAMRNEALRDHVLNATRAAFSKVIDVALDEAASALLISGDLYDGNQRSAKTAAFLVREIDRLRAAGIDVFYIKGNHDAQNPVAGTVDLPDNVHVFGSRGGSVQLGQEDIWIHGVSFSGKQAPESLLSRFRKPVDGAVNIAMLHTSLSGAPGHDNYAPCSVSELRDMGFDYWALGHVHKRDVHCEEPWVVMPGIPQGRDIGEAGPKSITLLDIDGGKITISEIPTSSVVFMEIAIDVSGAERDEVLRDLLREEFQNLIADLPEGADGIIRLEFTGRTKRHWELLRDSDVWRETAKQIAEDTRRLWIEALTFNLVTDDAQERSDNAVSELETLMKQIMGEPGFRAIATEEVHQLVGLLPVSQRAALLADEEASSELVARLLEDGTSHVLSLMHGAGD